MMMDLLIWISFLGSAIATPAAVIVQYRDLTPDGTSTMGGQMLSGALWSLVTAFCSIGILTVFLMAHLTAMLQLPVFSSFMLSSV